MATEEKKVAASQAVGNYRVVHGTVVKGTDALGERTVATVGELIAMPHSEAKAMLDVGVIEAV